MSPRTERHQDVLLAPTPDLEDGVEEAEVALAVDTGKFVEVASGLVTALQAAFAAVGTEPTTEPMLATTAWLSLTSTDTRPSPPMVTFFVSELTMVGEPSPLLS